MWGLTRNSYKLKSRDDPKIFLPIENYREEFKITPGHTLRTKYVITKTEMTSTKTGFIEEFKNDTLVDVVKHAELIDKMIYPFRQNDWLYYTKYNGKADLANYGRLVLWSMEIGTGAKQNYIERTYLTY